MNKKQLSILAALVGIFLFAYFVNFASPKIQNAIMEAFYMLQWYVRYHTLACVVPAMFIAGAIATFFSKEAVLRHLGPKANKVEAYGVASTSGTVLAVCSCSVLPMFAGIYRVGAGLGPASAFLYSGPAINVMAIFLTARVLGFDLGIARIIGSIVFAVVIGLIMAVIFRKDEEDRTAAVMQLPDPPPAKRSLWQTALFFVCMIAFLVFSDWANPSQTIIEKTDGTHMHVTVLIRTAETYRVQLEEPLGDLKKGAKVMLNISDIASEQDLTPDNYKWVAWVFHHRWYFAGGFFLAVLAMAWKWFDREELGRVDGPDVELLQVDHSALVWWRTGDRICRGSDSRAHRGQLGWRRQLPVQSGGFDDWRDVVLRHADRDSDPGGPDWAWDGTRAGVGSAAGRAGPCRCRASR